MEDLTGRNFGKLTVEHITTPRRGKSGRILEWHWMCLCECGGRTEVQASNLKNDHTTSCGCYRAEQCGNNFRTHGESGNYDRSSEYATWSEMKRRCYNPNCEAYKDYGARGIQICDRWLESFDNFLADMGRRPSNKHSIERKENDGDYAPDNCIWATRKVQNSNRRNNHYLTHNGETHTITEWSRIIGVGIATLLRRLELGWDESRTLSTAHDARCIKITYKGKTRTIKEWSQLTNIPRKTIWKRHNRGWSPAEVLSQ